MAVVGAFTVERYYTQPTGLEIWYHSEAVVWEVGVIDDSIDRYLKVAWLQQHNPEVNWKSGQVKWTNIFSREQITRLPEHTKHDHKIQVTKVAEAPCGPLYGMSKQELEELREWHDRQVAAEKIVKFRSSAGALILLVGKPDGSFHLCVDYRALNKVTVTNRYPLPFMTELGSDLTIGE